MKTLNSINIRDNKELYIQNKLNTGTLYRSHDKNKTRSWSTDSVLCHLCLVLVV